ncbi:L-arabinose transport system permease protein AraQ [Lacipirellula limnantheis]|uniref:L-arabinose transport system permease protein AraQ n=1 Tax=Lacipirellula limnantheis TaxID=2528024 RepID=A0A517U0P1_9BACT|nr:L-arabinose transport system permease protein AraQ [Lacipirellula limnantheis]
MRYVKVVITNVAVAVLGFLVAAPLLWMVGAAFMPRGTAQTYPPPLWPTAPTLQNFRELFSRLHLGRYLLNSLAISLAITSFALLLNAMAGYAFAKLRFVGREQVFRTLLAALVMPLQVGMLPLFLMLKQLGLINTYWAVIIPSMATIYGIFMVRQYALAIPDSLLDAARLDGASEWRLFFTIVLPLLRPVLATLGIFTFLSAWNDFMWPLIVLTGSENYTLPVALAILSTEHVQDAELMMAGSLITILPVLCLFILLQRQLIGGIMVGGVKG